MNFGVSVLHLKVTEKTEKPIDESIPKIKPTTELDPELPKAIIIIPIVAIKIETQTFNEIFSLRNKKARSAVKNGIAAKHNNVTAAVETEGFQVNVNGGYAAPNDVLRHEYTLDEANAALYGDAIYDIDSYLANGWAATARAVDAYGSGISSVDILQRDIEVRFTGEYEDSVRVPVTTGGVAVDAYNNATWEAEPDGLPDSLWYYTCAHYADNCEGDGGSFAWHDGARGYDIADHPDQGNVLKDGEPINIKMLISLIDNAKFIISNDTGPAHIASHLDKKGLVLFGSHTTATKVSIENFNFKAISVKNLNDLDVDTVLNEAKVKLS